MQQQTPPRGRLFPDPPQEQTQAVPRFSSTGTQPYEPQVRMQQTGAYPTYNSARYTTGSLQTLHGQPVQTLPPLATLPTAQAYQSAMVQNQQPQQANPMIVQTVQGTPVVVTLEQLQAALEQQKAKLKASEPELEEEEPKRASKARRAEKEAAPKKEREPRRERAATPIALSFSIAWSVFGVIGVISTIIFLLEQFGIPLLVYLHEITGGAL